ncbi:hypothetical protein A9Q99_16975 [Gammaproteobacteria bacterium 45_16_T64]|nr:hypothetical protein A9Q99_16975 [Gammaproteobacteria bacterium 45_16_T64]
MNRFQAFIVDHPWRCIFFTVCYVSFAAFGLTDASMNNDSRLFFEPDDPDFMHLKSVEAQFTEDDNVVMVIDPANKDMFTVSNLTLLRELTEAAWEAPKSMRVDSLANFQNTEVNGDELNVSSLVDEDTELTPEYIAKIKHIALNDPNLVYNLVSDTGHAAAVNISILLDRSDTQEVKRIMMHLEALRDRMAAKYPDVSIMISGTVAFKQAQDMATQRELSTTSIYGLCAILICLYIMLRSVASVLLTVMVIILSNLTAMGITSWLGVQFSPTLGLAPAMILTLAVADSIHILMGHQQGVRRGLSKRDAMYESLRVNMQPVFLTSATTAVGFLFLNSSESPPFREMGNMVSLGVLMAWTLSVIFLPAMVMVLPQAKYKDKAKNHAMMEVLADWVITKRKPIFVFTSIVFTMLALCSSKNEFNDVWFKYYDRSFEARRATDFMVENLSGFHRLQFAIPSGSSQGIMEPEYMQGVDSFVTWARKQHNVLFVSSFSDTIKRLNRDMNGGDKTAYDIPGQRELVSQYMLMYELSLPIGLGLENQVDFDRSTTRVNIMLGHVSSQEIAAFEIEATQWLAANLPKPMHGRGAGFDLLLGNLSISNMKGMIMGTTLALVVVSLLLIVALRSVKYGLLSMLPNLFPAAIAFGVWGLWVGSIGLAVSVVSCMTLGIVVDNTVHFLSKYIRAKKESQLSTEDATRYAFKTVGSALVATTLVLAANFGVMASSHFYPNASMGLLTAITVIIALLVNFFFFVPILLFVDNDDDSGSSDAVIADIVRG